MVLEITIYRLSAMIGNEVTPNYYGEAVFLRVSGFVQQAHAVGSPKARFAVFGRPLMRGVSAGKKHKGTERKPPKNRIETAGGEPEGCAKMFQVNRVNLQFHSAA